MHLILPVAGRSSRFPNLRPKWLLTQPDGKLMVISSILGLPLDDFDKIHLVVLKEHLDKYQCEAGIRKAFQEIGLDQKLSIIVLEEPTNSQPETVYEALKKINYDGAIYVKDSDNYFEIDSIDPNSVTTFDLTNMNSVNAANKSYVLKNDEGVIINIIEKKIISSEFCCGGYAFESTTDYISAYNELKNNDNLYISHLIFKLMLSGRMFSTNEALSYEDWGTSKEWMRYKSTFATLFVDIDGVLVKNSGKYFEPEWGSTESIKTNANLITDLYESGRTEIILTTARTEEYREKTTAQLNKLGIKYHRMIMGLMHCQRIIVNDYANSNPYPSCNAINIKRNDDSSLRKMLSAIMEEVN